MKDIEYKSYEEAKKRLEEIFKILTEKLGIGNILWYSRTKYTYWISVTY